MTNTEVAELLRRVSAAYEILGENRFKIIAYDRAADAIEHLTSDLKDMWDDRKLGEIPGVGKTLSTHLDELYKTGKVAHFESVLSKLPASIYPLLLIPGIGPKKAYTLVTKLKLTHEKTVVDDLLNAAKEGKIAVLEGFGERSEAVIIENIALYNKGQIKEERITLPDADDIARSILEHLRIHPKVIEATALGSLRRQVATIGDIDIAVATEDFKAVVDHFVQFPHKKVVDQGENGATLILNNGRQADLRVQTPDKYGAMLQYFTGSKFHNIKLRSFALEKGLSLNEYGIKHVNTDKITHYATEESFYRALGLPFIPPELREDRGEIEAAGSGKLPHLVELTDMKGDLHIHADYQFPSSHDLGASPVAYHLEKANALEYEYIGISDHNPGVSKLSEKEIVKVMEKRKAYYEQQYSSYTKDTHNKQNRRVEMFIMCEIDITSDGELALPIEAFEFIDAAVVSIHSSFTQSRAEVTKRLIRALTVHPKVRVLGHPTGRMLGHREGVDADWHEIMGVCREYDIAMEINSYPRRLDLPDTLVYEARKKGVTFIIDTDAHHVDGMDLMRYGVSVARRGWCTKRDIVNTMNYNEFRTWLEGKGG